MSYLIAMKPSIGLCYDLKIEYLQAGFSPTEVMEFDHEETIIHLEKTLWELGYGVERIGNGRALAQRLVRGDRWDLIFNLAEGIQGRSREAQVPALCELFNQPYTFSDPLTCALTLDKALAKRVIRDLNLPTAPFAIAHHLEITKIDLPMPLFLKPASEGSSKGITSKSLVKDQAELVSTCQELYNQFQQPILVETFLCGREVTVGIIGNGDRAEILGVMEIIFTEKAEAIAYTSLNKKEYINRIDYQLVSNNDPLAIQAQQLALSIYHALGCRDVARVDLRCDAHGELQFLEINPLPGLDHIYSDLIIMARLAGIQYREIIARIMNAAWQRYELNENCSNI